ncbi:response regulator transcription factor [Streptosporangium sp. NPDC001681]|uniref:response regulator transcription factor n=1 Tax=Streptosporangium sp. NPDC001681 TaxID=3154395 RepID=UPI00331CFBDB
MTNSSTTDIRVLICYSERLLRTALCSILAAEPGLRVVGDAGDGFEAVSKARGLRPDVALVDERLTGLDGIQVTERLRADSLVGPVRSVILTEQPEAMFDAVRAGARGFLLRSSDQDELVGAIRAIARGEAFFAPQVASSFLRRFENGLPYRPPEAVKSLTEREHEVLVLVADGLNNTEIASRLYVSQATVKFHVSNLLCKLNLRDRLQMAVFAHKAGVV